MAKPKGGLTKWFKKEKWVDISAPKKKGKYQPCGRKSAKNSKRGYPKCVPTATARKMTKSQIKSAVSRKRANPMSNVKTFTRKKKK
tara:strand:- start:4647 stop:4904 length:258 start_codon:yes stop_codon:yes gene_type:complete